MTRIVFMGSPAFAVPSLRAITSKYSVVGVVTQPDRPAGRGRALRPPPVKVEATAQNLPVIQPNKLSEPGAMDRLRAWAPDLVVVAAFGQLLRAEALNLPAHGCINIHASLLPRWRGAAPIQAAIAAGDLETGITIMKMDVGLDTGDILAQRRTPIRADDTGESLSERLAAIGAYLLVDTLPSFLSGTLVPQPQDGARATKAPSLKKEDGRLDPSLPADALERQVRAHVPWPGAYTMWGNTRLKVNRAHVAMVGNAAAGSRIVLDNQPALAASSGVLVLDEVQPEGRKRMSGRDFLLGARGWSG